MKSYHLIVFFVLFVSCGSDHSTDAGDNGGNGEPDTGWTTAASLPEPLQEFHAAVLNGQIYIAGGIGAGNEDSDRAYRYDFDADRWEQIADLPEARHHMPLAVVGDTLYAIGGLVTVGSSFNSMSDLLAYNADTDQWEERTPLPEARGASAAGVVDGRIIVMGGFSASNRLMETVDIYDPVTDSWTQGAPIPTPRDHLTAAVLDGMIYAIGGRRLSLGEVLDVVEVYDPEADEWTTRSPMPTARGGLGSAVLNNRIHVFGGEISGPANREHEVYNPSEDSWEIFDEMPEGRHGSGVVELNGRIFIIGGGPNTGFSQSNVVQVFIPDE